MLCVCCRHDTLISPNNALNVRFQTDKFTGKMVLHCHILEHEDEGMMATFQITGTEGALYTGAESIDATCYRGASSATTVAAGASCSTSAVGTGFPILPPSPPLAPPPPPSPPPPPTAPVLSPSPSPPPVPAAPSSSSGSGMVIGGAVLLVIALVLIAGTVTWFSKTKKELKTLRASQKHLPVPSTISAVKTTVSPSP